MVAIARTGRRDAAAAGAVFVDQPFQISVERLAQDLMPGEALLDRKNAERLVLFFREHEHDAVLLPRRALHTGVLEDAVWQQEIAVLAGNSSQIGGLIDGLMDGRLIGRLLVGGLR